MTPQEFKTIRQSLALSTYEMARAIGYAGERKNAQTQIRQFECGARIVPPWIERLVRMYERFGVPRDIAKL